MNSKLLRRATLGFLSILLLGSAAPHGDTPRGRYVIASDGPVSGDRLREAIDAMFDDGDMGKTRAVLILRDGHVVAERYADGIGPDTKLLSWSMGKSVTAVLIGLLVSDGRLALDAPAPIPAWSQAGDPRGAITLRQLLTMSSGLDHIESGSPLAKADTIRMLFTDGAQDMAGYAEAKPLAHRPGHAFVYSTATTMILCDILTRTLTDSADPDVRREAVTRFIDERLKAPVGLPSLTAEFDARGTMIGASFMHMTTPDYARFGEFLRNRGRAGGRQILSERWIDFMTRPSERNPAYGGQIWLNREGEGDALFPGQGPSSLFACVGHNGQYILISPSQRLTIVRLGVSTDEERVPLRKALGRLVELFPA